MFDDDTVLSHHDPPLPGKHWHLVFTGDIDALQEFFEHITAFNQGFILASEWHGHEDSTKETLRFCLDVPFGESEFLPELLQKEAADIWGPAIELKESREDVTCQAPST